MPKAKTPSLLEEVRSIATSKSRKRWDEKLTTENARLLRQIIAEKRTGEIRGSFLQIAKVLIRRFDIQGVSYRQVAQDLGELVRGDA